MASRPIARPRDKLSAIHHFAIATIALSIVFALLMQGHGAAPAPSPVAPAPSAQQSSQHTAAPPPPVTSGNDSAGPDLAPDSGGEEEPLAATTSGMAPAQLALDAGEMANLSPEARAAYLRKMQEEARRRDAQGPYRANEAEIAALRVASAARAGSEGAD